MKKSEIASTVAGVALFVLAAVFSISLLLVALGGTLSADTSFLYRMGRLFANVYGLCSVLIPAFLIVAGLQCFSPQWTIKRGIILFGSIIPFFTLDAIEHVARMIVATNEGSVLGIKLTTALLIGAVVLAVEYFLLAMLGDTLQHILAPEVDYGESRFARTDEEDDDSDDDESDADAAVVVTDDADSDEESADEVEADTDDKDEIVAEAEADDDEDGIAEDQLVRAPTTLANGEDNPFTHVFDEPEKPADEEIIADAESAVVAEEETVADEPVADEAEESRIAEPVADAEADEPAEEMTAAAEPAADEETFADNESVADDEEDFTPPPVPHYNENAPKFVSDEDDPEELVELDTFNPEKDLFEGVTEPALAAAHGEELDDDIMSEEEALVTETTEQADEDDNFGDFTVENYEPSFSDEEAEEADASADDTEETIGFDEAFVDDEAETVDAYDVQDDAEAIDADDLDEAEQLADELEAESEESTEPDFIDETIDDDLPAEPELQSEPELEAEPEPQKSGLDAIFAEMDDDAAQEPVFDEVEQATPIDFEDVDLAELEGDDENTPVVQSDAEDFAEDDTDVVRLEKPEPLIAEPKIEKKKIRGPYKVPSDLLDTYSNGEYWVIDDETKRAASDLKDTLAEFKIEAEVTGIRKGPVVTMFEILPAPGVKLSKIVALQDNIALRLAASSVRIVAPIPGKHAVGIEVPNKERAVVSFKEIVDLDLPQFNKMAIPVILGKDISGEPQVLDLAKTPHLLIAGSTGAGKSVCVNSMILSILYKRSPQDVKLIMIDPKVVELKLYNDIPHLLTPVITESKRAFQSLQYCLCEMERRYACLDGMGVRDIVSYNKRIVERNIAAEKLPYIVVIIDEFADLMATTGKELESTIARLAAMSRAVGIHLVLATQRPSIDVITGLIKANIPSRIAFMVASKMDSRIIIDQVGAEKLLGKGDMLFASATDPFPVRIQGTLVNDNEVEAVVDYVKQYGEPEYIDDEIFVDDDEEGGAGPGLFSDGEDPLYDEALQIVVQQGKASASYIQRRLKIGYNRAARLVEEMEERGIVGPANGSKPRELIHMPS